MYNSQHMALEFEQSTQRLAAIYRGEAVPQVSSNEVGTEGLPTTTGGVLHTVERHWLGAEGAMLVKRHIENGSMRLEREGLQLDITARTPEGTSCPIVWGVTVEGNREEKDILEPHLLVPEGSEVEINIQSSSTDRLAILGVFDQESSQPGMPPRRTPLLERNGRVKYYVGSTPGHNLVVFWRGDEYGHLKVDTAVKSEGGDLAVVEEGRAESALHGGLYLITIPEKLKSVLLDEIFTNRGHTGDFFGRSSRRAGPLSYGGINRETRGGELLGMTKSSNRGRVGGLSQGKIQSRGRTTQFSPDTQRMISCILRVRTTGGIPNYLHPAGVAASTEPLVTVKGALCGHCGVSAPKETYSWERSEFRYEDPFSCTRCGGPDLEPVVYKRRVRKQ